MNATGFTLDRKVPIALILTMLVQTLTIVGVGTAWVTKTNMRLERLEQAIDDYKGINERLARIEARQEGFAIDLNIALRRPH